MLTGLSFDAILRDIFLPLTCGGILCIPPDDDDLAPSSVVPWLEGENVTILHTVPTIAQAWIASLVRPASLRDLRWVLFSGEPLTDALVRRWRITFPKSGRIMNLYGPTETTMCKCSFLVPEDMPLGVQPVGWPLPDTQALVMASNGRLCGMGELGEIVLRTPFRTLGYINRPDLQRKRFVANPMRKDPGDLLYRTGDLGRFRLDGSLDICGRLDRQVKVRGARVEPQEIELALSEFPGVDTAVVTAPVDAHGDRRLVAYLVTARDSNPSSSELMEWLRQRLPSFMIPSAFVSLDRLPLTPAGKVDRKALPLPGPARPALATAYVPPHNPLELQLSHIWEELLGVSSVGVRDNFFDLGGHSLLAIRMMARIEERLGHALRPSTLFPEATIEHLTRTISREVPTRPWCPVVPIQPAGTRPPLFCVHPAGGSVLCYVDLARCIGTDQPVYGVQGPDPRGEQDPFEDAEKMAACYVKAIREVQRQGPYFLAGHSFGGLIALEMGKQLSRVGQSVALLDTASPRSCGMRADSGLLYELSELLEKHDLSDEATNKEDEHRLWEDLIGMARKYLPGVQWASTQRRRLKGFGAVNEFFRTYRFLPTDEQIGYREVRRYMRFLRANFRTARNYPATVSPNRITLLRADERLIDESVDPVERTEPWSTLAGGGFEVHRVPGNHLNLLAPPTVEALAAQLRKCIDRASTQPESEL